MKTKFIIIFIVTIAIAPAFAFQNEPDGFRQFKWGYKKTKGDGFLYLITDGTEKMYRRPADKLRIGNAKLDHINYMFYKNQLIGVIMGTKGPSNKDALTYAVEHKFGKGEKLSGRFVWKGTTTLMTLKCKYNHECTLIFASQKMGMARDADRRKEAEKAAKDF